MVGVKTQRKDNCPSLGQKMCPEEEALMKQTGIIRLMKTWKSILAKGISMCGGSEA